MKKIITIITLIVFSLLFVLSCETTKEKKAVIDYMIVSPNPIIVARGSSQDFSVIVHGTNNPPQTVTWSITGNNSSSTTINSLGLLSVASAETASTITVRATSTFDTSVSGTATANLVTVFVGDLIGFGALQWRVLDIQNGRALIISEDIIEQRAYHTSDYSITWEHCSLRAYLNGDFYNSFSIADRARIHEVTNTNENNQWFGTNGGNSTHDKIFLLSLTEVVQYFGDSGQLANRPSGYPLYITDQYNSNRIATFNGTVSWWWLRSLGFDIDFASDVVIDGSINIHGLHVVFNTDGGIRPALWLSL